VLNDIKRIRSLNSGSLAAAIFRALRAACTAQWRRRQERQAAAELHALSDYALRDLGIGRCQIDEQVRFPAKRYVRPHNSTGLI
jgi:uncharacterized protein YjiS (DUF1127 family)